MVKTNLSGFFPYTPSTNILFGLKEALRLIENEGLDNIFKGMKDMLMLQEKQ